MRATGIEVLLLLGAVCVLAGFARLRAAPRLVAGAWIAAGLLLAVGIVGALHGGVWLVLWVLGWLALCAGFVLMPTLAHGRDLALMFPGMLLAVLGVATAWIGIGFILFPVGLALYVGGAVHGRVLSWRAVAGAFALLALAVLLAWRPGGIVLPVDVAVSSCVAVGLGIRRH